MKEKLEDWNNKSKIDSLYITKRIIEENFLEKIGEP